MIGKEHYLLSHTIDIKYFEKLIKDLKKDNYLKIVHAGNIIIRENANYIQGLFTEIKNKIQQDIAKVDLDFKEMKVFSRLIEFLYIELNHLGFTKFYLNRFVAAIFSGLDNLNFDERFAIIESLKNRRVEVFEVIFGFDTSKFDKNKVKFFSNEIKVVDRANKGRLSATTHNGIDGFFEKYKDDILLSIKVETKDYYQALNQARKLLLKIMDILYLGYNDRTLSLTNECFIVGSLQPEKSSSLPTMYQIDGYYRSNPKVYRKLLQKSATLRSLDVSLETKNKINSGIRYLRMGGRSGELINKFVNYWIGLEYIFSTYDADSYTVGRLREYFKRCHSIIYLKRNLTEFHKDIKRLKEHTNLPEFNDDLQYLELEATYNYIIANSNSPLMIFRAQYYKELLLDPKRVRAVMENHQKNLEWNLTRIYRIRNEIVHNAAIKEDIAVLTSHLRYYLTFIINGLIDFLINRPIDINNDQKISIDDYFLLQDLTLASLETQGMSFADLMKIENPMELII